MRRGILELCLIIVVVIGIHAERLLHNGSIEGRIFPAMSSKSSVIAVQGNDSVKVTSNNGHFGMELQARRLETDLSIKELMVFQWKKKSRCWKVSGSIWEK